MFTKTNRTDLRIGTILALALLAFVLLFGAGAPVEASATSDHQPWEADYAVTYQDQDLTVYAQTQAQVDLALRAVGLYEQRGYDLPHVEMWMGSDTSQCIHPNGDQVRGFATWRSGQAVLFHCGDAFTMLHELAHVYDRHTLTDEVRQAFLALRGLVLWQDTASWDHSGEEHFANLLAWGLDESARREATKLLGDDATNELAFAALLAIVEGSTGSGSSLDATAAELIGQ